MMLSTQQNDLKNASDGLVQRLQNLCLAPLDLQGSDDCFFRAVSHQRLGNSDLHNIIRTNAVTHLREHQHLYFEIVTAHGFQWEAYLQHMAIL